MKNLKIILSVLLALFLVTPTANSQGTGSIILDHVDGLYAPDTIEVGKPITFHFRMQNNFGEAITGFSNGMRVYSPTAAIWDTADGAFTGTITPAMMDFGTFVSLRNVDGIGADTIGFGGVSAIGTGIPDQFNDTVWSITIGPIAGSEHLKDICIDSSFYSPSNIWLWVLSSRNVIPDWGGPYCFTIFDPTAAPPNSPPVLAPIGNKTVNENQYLEFDITASDPDEDILVFSTSTLPPGADFFSSNGGWAFGWTPDFNQSGTYSVTFFVSDGLATDSEIITITVNNVPCADLVVTSFTLDGPQEASLGRPIGYRLHATVQNIGDTVSGAITAGFFISADTVIAPPDSILSNGVVSIGPILPGDTISLEIDSLMPITSVPSASLPAFVFLGLNLDYTGDLTECNELNNTALRFLVVNDNLEPILDFIGDKSVNEEEQLTFTISAFDWDLDSLELLFFGELPSAPSFTDNGDGTGTFSWTPTFNDAGTFLVEFDVVDQFGTFDFEELTITVNNVNAPPTFDSLPDTIIASENDSLSFIVEAADIDQECLTLSMTSTDLPSAAVFNYAADCIYAGEFVWQTTFADSGIYTAIFSAYDDSGATVFDTVTFIINNVNQPPVIGAIGNKTVNEGDTLTFIVSSSDPDGGTPFMSMSSPDLPPEATFQASPIAVGVYTFNWPTNFFDAGTYTAIFTADDGNGGIDEDTISITVFDVSQDPVFVPTNDTTIDEGQLLEITFSAFDPDSTIVDVIFIGTRPPGATIVNFPNSTALFSWTPGFNQAGNYLVELLYSDDEPDYAYDTFTIVVNEVNVLPVIDSLPDTLTVSEGDSVLFYVYAEDFEDCSFSLQMTSPDLPQAATFSSFTGECSQEGEFNWLTNFTDAGIYHAFFTATDNNGGVDIDSVVIIVNNVNRPPVQIIGGENSIFESEKLLLSIQATDPDNDSLVISISSDLPAGALFVDIGNGNASLFWPTSFFDAGTYTAIFTASDGNGGIDEDTVFITVFNRNQLPVINPINDTTILENQELILTITGFDPDSESVFFDASGIPSGSNFADNGDGTATFTWTPTFFQEGSYSFVVFLYDNNKSETSDTVGITVENFNRLPSFEEMPDTIVVDENSFTSFDVLAADPDDSDCLSLSLSSPDLPEQAIFVYDGDCLYFGRFEWKTTYDDAGIYRAIFTVDDGLLGSAEDTVVIIVINKNQPPQFEPFDFTGNNNEGENINFLISATDGDSTIPILSMELQFSTPPFQIPAIGAQFTDNGDGTGTFDWTPDFNQAGFYGINFFATDDSGLTALLEIELTIIEAGDAQLTVQNATCVQCSPPQNFTDIIVTQANFSIEFNSQIITSSLNGNINFASASGRTFDYFYDEYSKLLYVFPNSELEQFAAADTITVNLTTGILDLSESPLDSNYSLIYFTGPVVYPGDADNNGVVDERDILSLGLYWNLTGPARDSSTNSLEFAPSPGHFQVLSEKWEPNLAAYADADGSGIVNADDICGVSFNFGLSSQPAQKNNGDMPAMKQLDNSVMQQLYNALIECPNSAGKTHLVEFLEDAINSQSVVLPTEVELYQNYPNPFNPSTMIEFYLPEQQYVTLDIYNILGQRVVSLVDRDMDAGFQSVNWSGRDNSGSEVASGIYFYLLKTDDRKISKRMMMLK